jgi:quercetin dioxygenase-like cupin family protein
LRGGGVFNKKSGRGYRTARPGDGWNIPGGVSHSVDVLEDCVVIEVFSPVREDYLP